MVNTVSAGGHCTRAAPLDWTVISGTEVEYATPSCVRVVKAALGGCERMWGGGGGECGGGEEFLMLHLRVGSLFARHRRFAGGKIRRHAGVDQCNKKAE